jgi:hypothetical protein
MSRARDLGSLINSPVAGKNLLINGGMDFWQRGTSFTIGTTRLYTADRWISLRGGFQTGASVSRQAAGLDGFEYSLRLQRVQGDTGLNNLAICQGIEMVNMLPIVGKRFVISFWAKAGSNFSASGSNISLEFVTGTSQVTPGDGIPNVFWPLQRSTAISTSWQRYEFSATMPSDKPYGQLGIFYTPTGTAGANDFIEIAGVQIEAGSVATPFSRAGGDIQGELAKCQRYYWRTSTGGTYKGFGFGVGFSTTQARCMIQFPQTMRTTPAGVEGGGAIAVMDSVTGYLSTGISIDGNVMTPQSAYVNVSVASGLTQYRPYFLYSMADANAYIGFSAEL